MRPLCLSASPANVSLATCVEMHGWVQTYIVNVWLAATVEWGQTNAYAPPPLPRYYVSLDFGAPFGGCVGETNSRLKATARPDTVHSFLTAGGGPTRFLERETTRRGER